MPVTTLAASLTGIDAVPIRVEVDLLRRLPSVCMVGLAANSVQEAAERVRSAIAAVGCEFPRKRVVVNLSPADVKKDGTAFDLPIALAVLAADAQIPVDRLNGPIFVGEVSLGGELRPIRGALSIAMLARSEGVPVVLPWESAAEAALVPGATVLGARTLADVVAWARGQRELGVPSTEPSGEPVREVDLADVRGQVEARHALEIAAAGAHHILMEGPPGVGKSMLARRFPTILPPLTFQEALQATQIHSVAGLWMGRSGLITSRPFRAPHHTITVAGMIGDRRLRPGEVSLAHHGVLFLDEASEFPRAVLEVLRTPLEDGAVRLVRAEGAVEFPARPSLVLAMNPCPCGYRGNATRPCRCTDTDVERYRRRLSGPMLDRIDIHIDLEPMTAEAWLDDPTGEPSSAVRARVVAARAIAMRRQGVPNAQIPPNEVDRHAKATREATELIRDGLRYGTLSARSACRVMKVARTLADLAGRDRVVDLDVLQAIHFRPAPILV